MIFEILLLRERNIKRTQLLKPTVEQHADDYSLLLSSALLRYRALNSALQTISFTLSKI